MFAQSDADDVVAARCKSVIQAVTSRHIRASEVASVSYDNVPSIL